MEGLAGLFGACLGCVIGAWLFLQVVKAIDPEGVAKERVKMTQGIY